MPSLLLHAADPQWRVTEPGSLCRELQALGLIAANSDAEETAGFRVGERFLQLVTFLGCSPQLVLDPDDAAPGQTVCCIRLLNFAEVNFIGAQPAPAVRCANCRAPAELRGPYRSDGRYRCEQCGKESGLTDLDWRQGAGFARCFVEIEGIHPHEAVPTDTLLNRLRTVSGCEWKYFYA